MSDAAKKLLDEAMSLPAEERKELALRLLLSVHDDTGEARKARWARLRAAEGCVHLGGDALEDTEALYNG